MLKKTCHQNCWLAGGIAGLLVWLFTSGFGHLSFFAGLFLGIVAAVLLARLLIWGLCSGRGGAREDAELFDEYRLNAPENAPEDALLGRAETALVGAGAAIATGAATAYARGRTAIEEMRRGDDAESDASGNAAAAAGTADVEASSNAKDAEGDAYGFASLASDAPEKSAETAKDTSKPAVGGGSDVQHEAAQNDAVAHAAAEAVAPVSQPAHEAPKAAAKADSAVPEGGASAVDAQAAPSDDSAGSNRKSRPEILSDIAEEMGQIADTGPDDLKQIKGVGPKLEGLLHENGITSFGQIAAWTEDDIDRFAALIGKMGGRIRSDDWIGQAKLLAVGAKTEFAARVDRGEVY